MIKGMIFDLDGTTLSTLEDIRDAINMTLRQNGYPEKDLDAIRLAVGNGSLKLISRVSPAGVSEEQKNEMLKEYINIYSTNYNIKTHPYKGIPELLQELQRKGILLGVNSNKPHHLTAALINECFPGVDFVGVIGDQKDIPKKPDPTGAYKLIEMMGLKKEEVLYIGDSETDIKTAKNAGLKAIGCLWGFRDRKILEEAEADYIVSEPHEILKYLGEYNELSVL